MLDLRYHALSLVAVFLALGLGIVLGVTLGDTLVSEADRGVRRALRADVVEAREEARRTRTEVERRDRLIELVFPSLAANRLSGRSVALVASGSLPDGLERSIRDALEVAGGDVDSRSVLDLPTDGEQLRDAVGEPGGSAGFLAPLGRRIGRSVVRGGRLPALLKRGLPDRFDGTYRGASAVVFYRAPIKEETPGVVEDSAGGEAQVADAERKAREEFEEAMLAGMRAEGATVVGVEASETEPSQVPFYAERDLSSVDNVDHAAGRTALVFALSGFEGSFGFKDTADDPLPKL